MGDCGLMAKYGHCGAGTSRPWSVAFALPASRVPAESRSPMAASQPRAEAAKNLATPQPIQGRVAILELDRLRDRRVHDALFDQAQRHTRVVATTSPRSEN